MKPVMLESGAAKVMMPEMLVAMIIGMGSGSALTPKGGLQELIAAYDRGELSTAATKEMWSGKFGEGAYKDEPWSIVALRKRVYAMRKFYELELTGTQARRECNPGWDDLVTGTLNSMALLLGTKPQHVPRVCPRGIERARSRAALGACVS